MSNGSSISGLEALEDTVPWWCFFEFLRHIFGAGISDDCDEHIAVGSQACKSLIAVLRHRVHLAAMSFVSKLSSDSLPPARQMIAQSECAECIIDLEDVICTVFQLFLGPRNY